LALDKCYDSLVRILVLFLNSSFGSWDKLYHEGSLKTWCKNSNYFSQYFLYSAKTPKFTSINVFLNKLFNSKHGVRIWKYLNKRLIDLPVDNIVTNDSNRLIVNCRELWFNITKKTLSALSYVDKNYDYDYLIRCNATCYVNEKALISFLEKIPNQVLYAGPRNKQFAAGWGIVMSRAAVKILLNKKKVSDYSLFDDEAIGLIFQREGIELQEIPYVQVSSIEELNQLESEKVKNIPLFRLKSEDSDGRSDHKLMKLLFEKLN